MPRRQSQAETDIPLPPWQPDEGVAKCPICETDFGLFYRKHHCRKCGRVVCANCSPHRITIPREYVVTHSNASEGHQRSSSGAEIVRVCRPCVPDPWTPHGSPSTFSISAEGSLQQAHQQVQQPQQIQQGPRRQSASLAVAAAHRSVPFQSLVDRLARERTEDPSTFRTSADRRTMQEIASRVPDMAPEDLEALINRTSDGSPISIDELVRRVRQHRAQHPAQPGGPTQRAYEDVLGRVRFRSGFPSYRTDQSNSLDRTPQAVPHSPASSSSPVQRQPPRPRREVREEDECPVCGIELPRSEAVRESHIQECLTTRFASTSPPPVSNSPQHTPSSTGAQNPGNNVRSRGTSFRSRGLVPYIATEKDCLDSEGREIECTICMEEFQPGAEMGRLECLCKFHRSCIREWWRVKGAGSCPVHVGPAEY